MREVAGLGDKLIIVGAGGHAKVVLDIALANEITVLGFIDDHATIAPAPDYQLLGTVDMLEDLMIRIGLGFSLPLTIRVRRQIDRNHLRVARSFSPHPSFRLISSSAQSAVVQFLCLGL